MTSTQYREALAALGLTQLGAANLFGICLRTSQYYAQGKYPVPRAIEIALRLMVRFKISPEFFTG